MFRSKKSSKSTTPGSGGRAELMRPVRRAQTTDSTENSAPLRNSPGRQTRLERRQSTVSRIQSQYRARFGDEDFDPEEYADKLFQSRSEEQVHDVLLELKKEKQYVARKLKRHVHGHYRDFIAASKEVSQMESDILSLRNQMHNLSQVVADLSQLELNVSHPDSSEGGSNPRSSRDLRGFAKGGNAFTQLLGAPASPQSYVSKKGVQHSTLSVFTDSPSAKTQPTTPGTPFLRAMMSTPVLSATRGRNSLTSPMTIGTPLGNNGELPARDSSRFLIRFREALDGDDDEWVDIHSLYSYSVGASHSAKASKPKASEGRHSSVTFGGVEPGEEERDESGDSDDDDDDDAWFDFEGRRFPKWVIESIDDLEMYVAGREYENAVRQMRLIKKDLKRQKDEEERIRKKLSQKTSKRDGGSSRSGVSSSNTQNSSGKSAFVGNGSRIPGANLTKTIEKTVAAYEEELIQMMVADLSNPLCKKVESHRAINNLIELDQAELGRQSFLHSRSCWMQLEIKKLKMKGDIELFTDQMAYLLFSTVRSTLGELRKLGSYDSSSFMQWVLMNLQQFHRRWSQHIFACRDIGSLCQCLSIIQTHAKTLERLGISLTLQLQAMWMSDFQKSICKYLEESRVECKKILEEEQWHSYADSLPPLSGPSKVHVSRHAPSRLASSSSWRSGETALSASTSVSASSLSSTQSQNQTVHMGERAGKCISQSLYILQRTLRRLLEHGRRLLAPVEMYSTVVDGSKQLIEQYLLLVSGKISKGVRLEPRQVLTAIANAVLLADEILPSLIQELHSIYQRPITELQKFQESLLGFSGALLDTACYKFGEDIMDDQLGWAGDMSLYVQSLSEYVSAHHGKWSPTQQMFRALGYMHKIVEYTQQTVGIDAVAQVVSSLSTQVAKYMKAVNIWERLQGGMAVENGIPRISGVSAAEIFDYTRLDIHLLTLLLTNSAYIGETQAKRLKKYTSSKHWYKQIKAQFPTLRIEELSRTEQDVEIASRQACESEPVLTCLRTLRVKLPEISEES